MRRIVICGLPGCTIFSTLRHDFREKLLNIKCAFWFCLRLLSEKFLILWRAQRHTTTNLHASSCKVAVILATLVELEFSRQIFETYASIKFHENPSTESRGVSIRTHRQTGGEIDMTKLIVAFRLFAKAPRTRPILVYVTWTETVGRRSRRWVRVGLRHEWIRFSKHVLYFKGKTRSSPFR